MKVYILSTYDEYGAEDVRATLDKSKVEALLQSHPRLSALTDYPIKKLRALLEVDCCDVKGTDITEGWGGFKLHIVELE